jgi:hypothetical protein
LVIFLENFLEKLFGNFFGEIFWEFFWEKIGLTQFFGSRPTKGQNLSIFREKRKKARYQKGEARGERQGGRRQKN